VVFARIRLRRIRAPEQPTFGGRDRQASYPTVGDRKIDRYIDVILDFVLSSKYCT